MNKPAILLAIAIGGALGAVTRFGLSRAVHSRFPETFPLGTLTVNILGCLAVGFCFVWLEHRVGPALRAGVLIGFLGAMTTFSTYALESIALIERGRHLAALANLAGSVLACLTAAFLGLVLGRLVFST